MRSIQCRRGLVPLLALSFAALHPGLPVQAAGPGGHVGSETWVGQKPPPASSQQLLLWLVGIQCRLFSVRCR